MGRPRKINVNELRQINGQVEAPKTVKEVTASVTPESTEIVADKSKETYVVHGALAPDQTNSVSNILKKYRKNIYGNYNETKEYVDAIRKMSLSQLHAHAIDVSIIPTSDKEKLIKNLENAFGVYINKQVPKIFPPSNLTVQASKNIEEIIAKRLNKKQ